MNPPHYFEAIRAAAAARWDQLEADPELAGPWHQLFRQVQSPRHVLSELLQNADDAGATKASVNLDDGTFLFEHNGEDFAEDHFRSLCRFGYSNKRTLHTIGFRGIGFKSTFSLGDTVELFSSSLAVRFHQSRFTEPVWIDSASITDELTRIRVAITDVNRLHEIEKNLNDWRNHPLALLFFRNLRSLSVCGKEFHWSSDGSGSVYGSEWYRSESDGKRHLLLRSQEEPFPDDALEEIRQERSLGSCDELEMPPCRVEIVLGAAGRIHVVLPTGVECDLPFACNAPFIQDPARVLIKDPSISPTNRWLLQRVGQLAAEAMMRWLEKDTLDREERSEAYGLMPNVDRDDTSIEGSCAAAVELAFAKEIEGHPVLLACSGRLLPKKQGTILPASLFKVWEEIELAEYFEIEPLATEITSANQNKLCDWGLVEKTDRSAIAERLRRKAPVRPQGWVRLFSLWEYLAPDLGRGGKIREPKQLHLVPTAGESRLMVSEGLVRIPKNHAHLSAEDWQFLSSHLRVVDPDWLEFLEQEKKSAESTEGAKRRGPSDLVQRTLSTLEFGSPSPVYLLIDQVAGSLFLHGRANVPDAVRLAQIAARTKAEVGEHFRFFVKGKSLEKAGSGVLFDLAGDLEELLPPASRERLLLEDYVERFSSCTKEEWNEWIGSGRAGVFQLPRMVPLRESWFHNKEQLNQELEKHGYTEFWHSAYSSPDFCLVDWDFENEVFSYWRERANECPNIWIKVVNRLIAALVDKRYWEHSPTDEVDRRFSHHQRHLGRSSMSAAVVEVARYNKNERIIISADLSPTWLLRLRDLPCLPDTRGFAHIPSELLRRTPATEAFIEAEPFVHHDLDTEATRPFLELLGVRDRPLGPRSILSRLQALAKADSPPIEELGKWYRRLDQILARGGNGDTETVRSAFANERLILTANGLWETASGVFLSSGEDEVPGAELVHPSAVHLALWRRVGVAERPTAELAIRWLKSIPVSESLAEVDLRRVRALLGRHPSRIWEEARHWLSLLGTWSPVDEFHYSALQADPVDATALFPQVKAKTADLRMLPPSLASVPPFSQLSSLASQLELRAGGVPGRSGLSEHLSWLEATAQAILRVRFDSEDETRRIHLLAQDLSITRLQAAPKLTVTPYLDGTPAGQAVSAEVAWIPESQRIYVSPVSESRLAKVIPAEIARGFDRRDIHDAMIYAYGRVPHLVEDYFEENFRLDAEPSSPSARTSGGVPSEVTTDDQDANLAKPYDSESIFEGDAAPKVDETSPAPPKTRQAKLLQPDLMERLCRKLGFQAVGEHRFRGEDGSEIVKVSGNIAPWERRDSSGNMVRRYWTKAQCLERDGIEVPYELWELVKRRPEMVSLIFADPEGRPVEVSGTSLRSRIDAGEIALFPATYRLAPRDLD
jgi:hypothetical protein